MNPLLLVVPVLEFLRKVCTKTVKDPERTTRKPVDLKPPTKPEPKDPK